MVLGSLLVRGLISGQSLVLYGGPPSIWTTPYTPGNLYPGSAACLFQEQIDRDVTC